MAKRLRTSIISIIAATAWTVSSVQGSDVISWPAPDAEALCEDYELHVNGEPIPVYSCRVSAMPFNQVWPGYQRPMDQTELAGFAYWDMRQSVRVEVRSARPVQSVVVRPGSREIRPTVEDDRIAFTLDRPGPVIVEVNGPHHALHLFPGAPQEQVPAADDASVRYFGPGIHRPGRIELQSGESVYIAGGAVVYGSIHATGASDIRISGRGILDVSPYPRGEGGGAIRLSDCCQVVIQGIVMRDPDVWCCSLFGCRDVEIADVKLVGLWRYNADGIDVCNSQDVAVRDCFVRAFDDALMMIVIRSNNYSKDDQRGTVRDVLFRDIAVTGPHMPASSFRGLDAEHNVKGVTIANLRFNGQLVTSAADARLSLGPHVSDVDFVPEASNANASDR